MVEAVLTNKDPLEKDINELRKELPKLNNNDSDEKIIDNQKEISVDVSAIRESIERSVPLFKNLRDLRDIKWGVSMMQLDMSKILRSISK